MKVMQWTKLLCCLLAVLMLACLFVACDNPEVPDQQDPDKNDTTDKENEKNPDKDEDDGDKEIDYLLTVKQENFFEETITILCREDKSYEIDMDQDSGALVEKAVFDRNARVEEYLNVEIVGFPVNGSWPLQEEYISVLAQAVATTDNSFQLAATHSS